MPSHPACQRAHLHNEKGSLDERGDHSRGRLTLLHAEQVASEEDVQQHTERSKQQQNHCQAAEEPTPFNISEDSKQTNSAIRGQSWELTGDSDASGVVVLMRSHASLPPGPQQEPQHPQHTPGQQQQDEHLRLLVLQALGVERLSGQQGGAQQHHVQAQQT